MEDIRYTLTAGWSYWACSGVYAPALKDSFYKRNVVFNAMISMFSDLLAHFHL